MIVINDNDKRESYSSERLLLSLLRVSQDLQKKELENILWIKETIEQRLLEFAAQHARTIQKKDIIDTVLSTLKNYDATLYVRYLADHTKNLSLQELKRRVRNRK